MLIKSVLEAIPIYCMVLAWIPRASPVEYNKCVTDSYGKGKMKARLSSGSNGIG